MINEYENILRRIVITVLGEVDNTDYKVSPERIEKWKEKREIESKKYKGTLSEKRIIYYSDFYDLEVIIEKNWAKFKKVLHDKKKFFALFSIMDTFRNTIAHGRSLFSYQEKLVEGITGDLQATLVKYHNKNMSIDDYFIKILKMSDDLGHTWEAESGFEIAMITNYTLRVGDRIEIKIEAFDPKGREIEYKLRHEFNFKEQLINNSGVFNLEITSKMIKRTAVFYVTARTEEEQYSNEKSMLIHYTVLP
jgi:hypothetical protein